LGLARLALRIAASSAIPLRCTAANWELDCDAFLRRLVHTLQDSSLKPERHPATATMGVPFEALLPYGIMLGLFGVTVRLPPLRNLTLDTDEVL
jgi:hypothetical protein